MSTVIGKQKAHLGQNNFARSTNEKMKFDCMIHAGAAMSILSNIVYCFRRLEVHSFIITDINNRETSCHRWNE